MMEVDFLPEHLVILGGSVGLEFAQMYRRFGKVTVVQRNSAPDPARGRGRLAGDPRDPGGGGDPGPDRRRDQVENRDGKVALRVAMRTR